MFILLDRGTVRNELLSSGADPRQVAAVDKILAEAERERKHRISMRWADLYLFLAFLSFTYVS